MDGEAMRVHEVPCIVVAIMTALGAFCLGGSIVTLQKMAGERAVVIMMLNQPLSSLTEINVAVLHD